ncbi:hypothetical protein [Duffyella gerundensis]|uniref:hypothetical protein n=1 Tax=Duffyella TaxID=3026546 RepID=UPI00169E9F46
MTQTPREAQFLIDQIEQELMDWSRNFNVVHQENNAQFQRADNVVADFREVVALVSSQIDDATDHLNRVREKSQAMCELAADTQDQANRAHQHAAKVYQRSLNAAAEWRDALQRAVQLVNRCQAAKLQAASEVSSAQTRAQQAANDLAHAQNAYNSCMNSWTTNSKGERQRPNCSSDASRVTNARHHLDSARRHLNQCEFELQQAIDQLNAAFIKQQSCENGVAKTEEALVYAQQARDRASQASNSASEARQWADEAWQQAESGVRLAQDMQSQHNIASQQTALAEEDVADALQDHAAFARALEEYQRRQWQAREELGDAFEALRQINSKEGL